MASPAFSTGSYEGPTPEELARFHLDELLRQGISQRYLAGAIDVPRSTLGDFLRGTHAPSVGTVERILAGLGL